MKSPHRLRRLLSFTLCCSLLAAPLTSSSAVGAARGQGNPQNSQARKVKPAPAQPGPPAASLPDLDGARRRPHLKPQAPPPVISPRRSRRKPLESRRGRRVGDPLPPVRVAGVQEAGEGANDKVEGYGFSFLRFIVSPFYDQAQLIPDPALSLGTSFDFFSLSMLQAGGAKVVFSSNRDGHTQIYLMNADGSSQVRLTNNGANDDNPRFSPNGSKILFQSDRDSPSTGYNDIYVMNADGSGQTRLTTDANDDRAPSWSPDGTKVVFQSLRNGVSYQVYSMNADGTNQVNLGGSSGGDRQPSWSPDGSKIAFASERDHTGYASVYVMNADGTGQQRLTFSADNFTDEQPVWSRDGAKIAFVSTRDSVVESWQETDDAGGVLYRTAVRTNKEVYVMNADGTGQTRLTHALGNDDAPYWSPDETKIVFRSDRERDCCDPTSQVWTMSADGTGAVNLSGNGFGDYGASWTSSGGNLPPVADAGGSYSGITGQNTAFSGAGSFDSDGSVASYSWSFGDGATGTGVEPTHAYSSPGTYTVTLTVTDNLGAQGSATATASVSSSSGDQYTASFLQSGLARQPSGDEGSYWADIMRAAYPRGQTSMLMAMRELGMTVFESSEYAARNRSDHWYVYDLYKTYLMREPDASGWAFWESCVPSMGREQLRRAFNESGEFQSIVATLTASGTPSSAVSSLASARVNPFNQTGDQLRARDCEWGVSLLSLPGRAGLDLGLGLSYSSLVWTRSGPYAYFDEDRGSPSPGFRLEFATIQGPYFDAQVGRNVYMLVTSSGSRVGLRQVGTTSTYEAGDSSYLQLIVGGSLLLRSTDGMQIAYSKFGDEWRATAIEDRNGNFISVGYDWRGDITSVTDTLGRVVTFNYDTNANLSTIQQTWQVNGVAQTHVWASFGWGTKALQSSAGSLAAVGIYSGESIPVLMQVGLGDGSRYNFEYTGAGQVNIIRRFTSDNVERSRMTYDYATLADDCPRVTGVRVWAENWTGINGVPSEVVTQLDDPGDGSHEMTSPDGTVYKEVYGTGWQKGLATQSEVRSGGALQKQTTTQWTQDDTIVGYQTNPRVIETNIYDFPVGASSNRRRTTIDYGQYAQYGLPYLVKEYAGDGTTPLRQSYTDYNLSQAYLDRRIIGLVSTSRVYDPVAAAWLAKTTYAYDASTNINAQATTAVGHDQSYSSSFLTRGNVTSVSRWDAGDISNAAKALTSQVSYDAAGSTLSSADAMGHQTSIGYADSYSDGNNSRNTFAYPTTLTDADGFSSSVQYNFDFGARTRAQGPPPAGQSNGIIQTIAYDAAARIERVTTTNTGAYTRYLYGPNYVVSLSSVKTIADEAYTNTVFDGAGRAFIMAGNNPGSGGGGFRAQHTQYDLMGRAAKRSNPAETGSSWNPAGDDAAGWLYTAQSYDWKDRPKVTTNPGDGTQSSAVYDGCGCAGGEVVTLTDEAGRQQKVYSDSLGRQWKSETLNWDGSVYSTTENTFNALDQVTQVKEQAGVSGTAQFSTMTYDGYGRLQTRKAPIQSSPVSYTYDADDVALNVTDPRGVVTTYGFTNAAGYTNKRHLVNSITYSNAPPGVPVPAQARFEYDAAGNPISMTDGTGSVTYGYNALSQLTSEARHFTGLPDTYETVSDYTLSGQLKYVIDPAGSRVDYEYDAAGRTLNVTGSGPASASSYASSMSYRAWGALKDVDYGNGAHQFVGYDARLRASTMELRNVIVNSTNQTPLTMKWNYDYYPDGRLNHAYDLNNGRFDHKFDYDDKGRMKEAYSGLEARGLAATEPANSPYRQTFGYDVWGNMTARGGRLWKQTLFGEQSTYTNDRREGWLYDQAGNLVESDSSVNTYDAAGQQVNSHASAVGECGGPSFEITQGYDGDGRPARRDQTKRINLGNEPPQQTCVTQQEVTYYVYSAALGGAKIAELGPDGEKLKGYVYGGGGLLAKQEIYPSINSSAVVWQHPNPGSASWVETAGNRAFERQEMDPLGQETGAFDPFIITPNPNYSDVHGDTPMFVDGGDPFHLSDGCGDIDGLPASCSEISERLGNGTAVFTVSGGRGVPQQFAPPDIGLGFVPTGVWVTTQNTSTVNTDVAPGADRSLTEMRWATFNSGQSPRRTPRPQPPQNPQNPINPLDDGFKEARNALANPLCRSLFRGIDPLKVIDRSRNSFALVPRYPTSFIPLKNGQRRILSTANFEKGDVAVTVSFTRGNSTLRNVYIDSNGWFVNGYKDDIAIGLTLSQRRAVTLIHELLHFAGIAPNDDKNYPLSHSISAAAKLFCYTIPNSQNGPIKIEEVQLSTQLMNP